MKKDDRADEELKINPEYIKGFEWGYDMRQLDPKLASYMNNVKGDELVIQGFKAGKSQYEFELKSRENEKLPKWLKTGRAKESFNEKAIPRTKDKDDRER